MYDGVADWSPDGHWIAFVRSSTNYAIFKARIHGTELTQLTPWSMNASNPQVVS
jgi:Tol biopolymer transport system component